MDATIAFVIAMVGWAIIIYNLCRRTSKAAGSSNASVQGAFSAMRLIVLVGWAIYPLGYVFGYMLGQVDANTLNIVYNLADFVNKILFGLVIWNLAIKDSGEASH